MQFLIQFTIITFVLTLAAVILTAVIGGVMVNVAKVRAAAELAALARESAEEARGGWHPSEDL